MAQKLFEESYIASIAEAIREKNGTTNKYTVAQMADAIRALSTGGGDSDTITFTIDGKEYTVDNGTTWTYWADWLQTDGYTTDGTHVVETEQGREVTTANGDKVLANSVIESGDYYCRTQPQGDTITFTIPDTYDDDTGEEARTTYTTTAGNNWEQAISDKVLPSGYVIRDLADFGDEGVIGVAFDDWGCVVCDPDTNSYVVPTNPIEAKDYYLR